MSKVGREPARRFGASHRGQLAGESITAVVQQDRTGCAIASVAALTGKTYAHVRQEASGLGIQVDDERLWSDTQHMRKLLARFRIRARDAMDFSSWDSLPDRALLAIKWHVGKTGPAWHWVVFVREPSATFVLDPKRGLRTNRRTDFGRMKPKWFIPVEGS